SPQDVFNRPQNAEVARIVGMESALEGRIVEASAGLLSVDVSGTLLHALGREESVGPDVFVCIRAEDVVLEKGEAGASSARNRLRGTVRSVNTIGALARVEIDCGFPLSAVVTRPAVEDLHLVPGVEVTAFVKAGAVHLVPRYEAVASGAA
ncbi:MAG: molybdopterin-binding protein, partial [Nitrospiraceae bacterium]